MLACFGLWACACILTTYRAPPGAGGVGGACGASRVEVVRKFGDLRIDIDSHEVHVDNVGINLTALEFKLLRQLVDTRGRVQSRDQLLSEVWGYSSEVTTRTVDTHIKRLREKLGPMGKYVQTIRGVGYKFARSLD